MSAGIWSLRADLPVLESAARAWQRISDTLVEVSEGLATVAVSTGADWTGSAAEQFEARRLAIAADLDLAADYASSAASALTSAVASVRTTQGSLDSSWASVSALPWGDVGGGAIEFQTTTEAEQNTVNAAIGTAEDLRAALDGELVVQGDALTLASTGFAALVTAWEPVVSGSQAFVTDLPPVPDVGIRVVDGEAVISTGEGDEHVTMRPGPDGKTIVTIRRLVDGRWTDVGEYAIPAGVDITIRAGGGNDIVTLPPESSVAFTVVGGEGRDRITGSKGADRIIGGGGEDEIETGDGIDYVSAGAGRDYVDGQGHGDWILGGRDRDALYGMGGVDRIDGGSGGDYLEGGVGDDRLQGGSGEDQVSGGRDDDQVVGGAGNDVAYGGQGSDQILGGSWTDTTYDDAAAPGSESESAVTIEVTMNTSEISISGSEEFRARVQADLDMLAGSPTGRAMLESLQNGLLADGDTLLIQEYLPEHLDDYNNGASEGTSRHTVSYMPNNNTYDRPPVVGLYHELAHVHSYVYENIDRTPYRGQDIVDAPIPGLEDVEIAERQATGLGIIDHDGDPSTAELPDPARGIEFTENGLRREMGIEDRLHYRRDPEQR